MAKGKKLKNQPKGSAKGREPVQAKSAVKKTPRAKKASPAKKRVQSTVAFLAEERVKKILGVTIVAISIFLFLAFISHLFSYKGDFALLEREFSLDNSPYGNIMGKIGALTGRLFIHYWFGLSAFAIPLLLFVWGLKIWMNKVLLPMAKTLRWSLVIGAWLMLALGFIYTKYEIGADGSEHATCGECLCGHLGFQSYLWLQSTIGKVGVILFLLLTAATFVIFNFNPSLLPLFEKWKAKLTSDEEDEDDEIEEKGAANTFKEGSNTETETVSETSGDETELDLEDIDEDSADSALSELINKGNSEIESELENESEELEIEAPPIEEVPEGDLEIEIEEAPKETELSENELDGKVKEFGEYDPKLDLSRYELPTIDLLQAHGTGNVQINKEELEENKNRIVQTLNNYKIEISKIKATIGPTVTLYEIVPAAGVRISKIKNLEDDIALSLAALGIRIIAPIPGKGTIGIEVPNREADIVSMRSLIASDKFQNSDYALPVALGKTISNETFIADLAKMPHLLMAGATGQGKSVGLNAILVSLLYKKHPSQIKFVLVDPKKVELSLFNKIERHYLAKLPDEEEAIITDTSKVIKTLNSLCVEMDQRYELLKTAHVRNLKEYNAKFIKRRLNPEEGHRYLPYIVLVVDEFADLIMTAGKEVETPIARLAQLARAIGIHLIIATQRPSVNIITGVIKANFPARIAFRVTSKIDSRTILDSGGAEQLIGRGDMLFSTGSDLIRIQCGFVDTPEVDSICDYIGGQQGYPSALLLPEVAEETSSTGGIDLDDRDELFEDAARILVIHQQGSASLLQRKLKLGYNRAGRLIDQLEAAGIIGPFEGSKARKVLIPDEMSLEQLLNRND